MKRRDFLAATGAMLAATPAVLLTGQPAIALDSSARRLVMPPLLDTRASGRLALTAQSGSANFLGGTATPTLGFNQNYLGPTIIVQNGSLAVDVLNTLDEPVSVHWHGMMVPGEHDGGPHLPVLPTQHWTPELAIKQAPATVWYHSHIHEETARQVYSGLAGVIQVTDGRDDARGLPIEHGVDDLTLVLQDRRFDESGRMVYNPSMMDVMHGFGGNRMLVNGQSNAFGAVPAGIVRLRLLNGSNGRIYNLFFDDSRPMHLVATDGGFLPSPVTLNALRLAPGERAEVLVDFSVAGTPTLMSNPEQPFPVLPFVTDGMPAPRITRLPGVLDDAEDDLRDIDASQTRQISLEMGMGMGMGGFAINGRPFDMNRIDFEVALGSVERWFVRGAMVAHPFHVHGVRFQVVSENGASPSPENSGRKDTVLVWGEAEIIARFDQPASADQPFMFHCHILEHEDAGMMGQFSVT